MKMTFGKYKGVELGEIPIQYLTWLRSLSNISPNLRDEINDTLTPQESLPYKVEYWYRFMCSRFSQDRGGTKEAMQAIHEAHSNLKYFLKL